MSSKTREINNKHDQLLTSELVLKRKNKINKITIGLFIFIIVASIIIKIVDGALQDFGFGIDELMSKATKGTWSHHSTFHTSFWLDSRIVAQAKDPLNTTLNSMVLHHPNFLWLFTQFTWITTIIILLFLIFRLFKYEQSLPRWLRWIMTQRTLSLIVMYDMIVGVVFWSSMFKTFQDAFVPGLSILEFIMTVLVHAVIPLLILAYSVIYLTHDKDASALKEMFVLKGMIYPTIYFAYYILVSQVWQDPYGVTDFHNNFVGNLWKIPAAGILIWIMLGIMLLIHNNILFKYNKLYDPENDFEIIKRREDKIAKIKRKVANKYARSWANEKDLESINRIRADKKIAREDKKKAIRTKELKVGVKTKKKK